jgi:hypothetical protein
MNPRTMIGQSVRFVSSKLKKLGFKEFEKFEHDINGNYVRFILKPDSKNIKYFYKLTITFEGEYNE